MRRLLRGLLVGLFTLPIGILLDLMLLSNIWNRVPGLVVIVVAALPLFFALLVSMRTALSRSERGRAATIPV